jgi:tetratricopeptide (TPR) repeat protein
MLTSASAIGTDNLPRTDVIIEIPKRFWGLLVTLNAYNQLSLLCPEVMDMDVVATQLRTRGISSLEAGMFEEAVKCFKILVEHDPKNWSANRLLGVALQGAGQTTAARHQLTFVLENCPDEDERKLALADLKEALASEKSPPIRSTHWSVQRDTHLSF